MELRNIKTFIKIAEIGNFSRAAVDLGYAQSTVTMQIQTLERELGVPLFERSGKTAVLSAAGREFLDYAYSLQRCEAMALEHFAEGAEPQGEVSVGIMETMCASRYGEIFREFKIRYPKANVKVVVATTLECMELLEKGKLDLILTVDKRINRINWMTAHEIPTEICFFCPASHPFAGKSDISLDRVLEENFIMIEEGCNYRQAFEQYVVEQRRRRPSITEIGYTRLIIDAVEANLGVSLLPKFTLEEALQEKKIALFSVKDYSISMLMQVIYSKNRWISPAMKAFLQMTREFIR